MSQKENDLKKLEQFYHSAIKQIQDAKDGHEISIILSIIMGYPDNGDIGTDTKTYGRREEILVGSLDSAIEAIAEYPDEARSFIALRAQAMIGESTQRLRAGNKTPPTTEELDALIEQAKLNHRVATCPNIKLH
ncbi:hypothetical protein [Acetobacter orleanensis]|uniref:hypothetical protein n=1 Tax=Acetobacter orleanensis TaxID=104099 RepID=UPI000A8C88D9|nr:hypothetical protein [Acetobacter orleanensis]